MDFALFSADGGNFVLRYLHVLSGIVWIGHLYYINFCQGGFLNGTDAATKSNVIQKLVPTVLWWFRWGAMATFITGLLLVGHLAGTIPGYFTTSRGLIIAVGMTYATLMFLNVWLIIWPAQKVIIQNAIDTAAGKPANPEVAALGARALVASRTNVLFSMPMLFLMLGAPHLGVAVTTENLVPFFAVFSVLIGLIEFNAVKGKVGPMATVKGVIHFGLSLTVLTYVLLEVLTK